MSNAPENFDAWVLPDGVEKVTYTPDTKVDNCGTFRIEREDHTIGNLLRMQLLRDPSVVFVGYKHPHPIEHYIQLRVRTASSSRAGGARNDPPEVVRNALIDLSSEALRLSEQLKPFLEQPPNHRRYHSENPPCITLYGYVRRR